MKAVVINYTGKKARAGNLAFDCGHLGVFVGYCPSCNAKIIMELDEAKDFAARYYHEQNKLRTRLIKRQLEKIR